MRLRLVPTLLLSFTALSFSSSLFAQANPPARPRVGDLKEEQRLISNAYLGDADFQIKRARERLGGGNNRLAQQSGLWALEQIAYAKRRLERHAPKIEEAGGAVFERTSESTRKDLRDSYAKVREAYVNIEERLDTLAEGLKKAGLPILLQALNDVRSSSGDDAVKIVGRAFQSAGEKAQGDKSGNVGEDATTMIRTDSRGGTVPLGSIPGGTAMQSGSNVMLNIPGIGSVSIPGSLSADGRSLSSAEFGNIDLSTGVKLPDGSTAFQSDRGVVVVGKDGKARLIANAKLNPDGSITLPNGQTVQAGQVGGYAQTGGGGGGFTPKPGDTFVDANGNRITVGPDWSNGKQSGVSKDYIGGAGGRLMSEAKVTRSIVGGGGGQWKVEEAPGESRSWNFSIKVGEQKSSGGTAVIPLSVDGGGSSGFTIKSWEVVDDAGNRASVAPSGSSATATITKGGQYSITAVGETEWGSPFKVTTHSGVYP